MATTELGAALHQWRSGLARDRRSAHRRAQARHGLRREELSQLAGVSADYIVRLEQGRATNPSPQIVEALARALRLTQDERDHLFRLARLAPPGPGTIPRHITPGVTAYSTG